MGPQGSILSVTLFGLKINSVVKAISPGVECSLYVDDFLICYRSKHNYTNACLYLVSSLDGASPEWGCAYLIAAYYSFIYPERMKGCILLWYSCFISLSSNFMFAFPSCRLKVATLSAYIVLKSGKPQPIRSPYQSRYTCTAQGPTTFTKFWTGSDKWRRNGGLGRVPDVGFFL